MKKKKGDPWILSSTPQRFVDLLWILRKELAVVRVVYNYGMAGTWQVLARLLCI